MAHNQFDIYSDFDINNYKIFYIKSDKYGDIFRSHLGRYELEKQFLFEAKKPIELTPSNYDSFEKLKIQLVTYDHKLAKYIDLGYKYVQINEIFREYGEIKHYNCNCHFCLTERYILSTM